MNFLQLVNRVRLDCDVARDDLSTLVGAIDEDRRIAGYVSQAWLEIQEKYYDWDFLRHQFAFQTIVGKAEYTPAEMLITDFSDWRRDSFRIYTTSAGYGSEIYLQNLEYNSFRDYYLLNIRRTTQARPIAISITPTRTLILGLVPNDIYTVNGEYYSDPIVLSLDADTPIIPSRFHMAIVYKAMVSYGMFESAGEVVSRGEKQYNEMIKRIERYQAPYVGMGNSLI